MAHEAPEETPAKTMLSGNTYDRAKQTAAVWLPAIATLYFALAKIWNLPGATEVVATITALNTFLGAIVIISSKSYNKSDARFDGSVTVAPDGTTAVLNIDPADLLSKSSVALKIK